MARPVPTDLEDALAASPTARERFWAMPPELKDEWVGWVERARLPGARRRRVGEAVRRLAARPKRVRETAAAVNGRPAPPREHWAAWLLGLVLLAGIGGVIAWYTAYRTDDGGSKHAAIVPAKSTVPKVVGLRYQAAQFQLREAKLASTLVRRPAKRPKGIVLGQRPKAGATVPKGTSVALVVSNGPPNVAMPDVVGLVAADAVRTLRARKLAPTLQKVASQEAPGTVLAQTPKAGARARPGTEVVLAVAKAQPQVAAPAVTGQSLQQAVAALEQAGLHANVVQVPSTQPKGTVIAQHPSAGQKVARAAAVRLNVSTGTQQTTTAAQQTTTRSSTPAPPSSGHDYTGMRLSTAIQQIAQGRQQAIVVYATSTKPAGVVVSNSKSGTRVRLQVSAGSSPRPLRTVPDQTGSDAATAQQELQAAGFSVIQVQWPVSDQSLGGVVVYETPAGPAPEGSAIVLYVGTVNA
jgi:beta-lactam-binding protein with PASTA domain